MPQQSPADIVIAVLDCFRKERTCLIDAILTDDKQERIKKAMKCIADQEDCIMEITPSKARQRDAVKLEERLRKGLRAKRRR